MSQYLWTWLYVCLETQIHWCSIQIQWSLLLKTDLKTTSICPKKLLIYIYPLNIFQNGLKTKEEKTFSKILKRIKNMKSLFRTINISSTYVPLKRSQQTTPRNQRQRFPPPATITHTHTHTHTNWSFHIQHGKRYRTPHIFKTRQTIPVRDEQVSAVRK